MDADDAEPNECGDPPLLNSLNLRRSSSISWRALVTLPSALCTLFISLARTATAFLSALTLFLSSLSWVRLAMRLAFASALLSLLSSLVCTLAKILACFLSIFSAFLLTFSSSTRPRTWDVNSRARLFKSAALYMGNLGLSNRCSSSNLSSTDSICSSYFEGS